MLTHLQSSQSLYDLAPREVCGVSIPRLRKIRVDPRGKFKPNKRSGVFVNKVGIERRSNTAREKASESYT
jgi:hypothetical protein